MSDWSLFSYHNTNLSIQEKEKLIEISSDDHLKVIKCHCQNVAGFWIGLLNESTLTSEKALELLLPFHSTYLCEGTFSTIWVIKNKHRNNFFRAKYLETFKWEARPRESLVLIWRYLCLFILFSTFLLFFTMYFLLLFCK